ncbi:hypothetical protein GCK32_022710, partial [Trichostrongylus colubriformis]
MYFPWESQRDEADDPSHFPSNDIPSLRTKQQTIQALESSIKLTERSWKIWQTQYLTSLREHHQVGVKTKRGGVSVPCEGNLVLIQDETQPRHSWKMGRIEEICPNSEGIVREVKVRLPSRRCIRRPVNLLIPLELEGTAEEKDSRKMKESVTESGSSDVPLSVSRYNLRPRRPPTQALTMVSTITTISLLCCLVAIAFGHTKVNRDMEGITQVVIRSCESRFLFQIPIKMFKGFRELDELHATFKPTPLCMSSKVFCHFYVPQPKYCFRLDPRDVEGGPKYLYRMIIESKPSVQRMETDMMATFNEIQNQVTITASLRKEWFHLMCSASLREMGAAERIQLFNHFLLNASLTKERLLRFGTRYVMTDRVYDGMAQVNDELQVKRNEWIQTEEAKVDIKDVMGSVEKEVRHLETTIKEIKEYMVYADRE